MNPACPRIALMPSSFSIVITSHSSSIPSPRLRAHCAATLAAVRQGDHAWVSANSGADYILRTYSGHTCTSWLRLLHFIIISDAPRASRPQSIGTNGDPFLALTTTLHGELA